MPIILNNSNIEIQYNTGSSYIIETVKSDLYVRGTTSGNLSDVPTVSPTLTTNIATFTHSGGTENQTPHTIYFPENTVCDILIVGGGGGGGASIGSGGGAGGLISATSISISAGSYNIIVGKGGVGAVNYLARGANGNNSSAFGYTAYGGGGGAGQSWVYNQTGTASGTLQTTSTNQGSGAGGTRYKTIGNTGTTGQGNSGGNAYSDQMVAGGGGGAGGSGGTATNTVGGRGGIGVYNSITGTSVGYAGGGAGMGGNDILYGALATEGGGSSGSVNGSGGYTIGLDGNNGKGGGGGGGSVTGGNGGSGIVIIKVISPTTNKYLFFNYSSTQTNYTLTFPVRTLVDVNNNNNNLILQGQYNVSLGTANSSIIPSVFNTSNRLIPLPNASTSNVFVRYHTLNPIKTTEGAQWTYSSNNPNVYHLGSVGIGTTSPEYSLDVRGFIYSSSGGYTSSALTKWSVLSDRRIKENIVKASYEKCLENVKNIELYNFNFKDNYVNTNDRHQLGFIAQEVQQIYPKAVEFSRMIMNLEEKIDDLLTLNTTQIDYTLYGAVKCLIQKLENIKIKMEQIKTVYNITT